MTVAQVNRCVKSKRRPGRPLLRTQSLEVEIIRSCVRTIILLDRMPSDADLAQLTGLGERTVRGVRLNAGLNRWDVARWVRAREAESQLRTTEEVLCWTPYAGLWLLVPLILRSALLPACQLLHWTVKTGVDVRQWLLTVLMWTVLGFRRFFHLEDFRHRSDLGLALFTGRVRLLSDSSIWRLVHQLNAERAEVFYRYTAAQGMPSEALDRLAWISLDEHVIGFFTKLKPRPLRKDRIPTRGRAYPAIRLYAPFHLDAGRFLGLIVTEAQQALSQVLPTLLAEVRRLQALAGRARPGDVAVLMDRGGYKGSLFEELMEDPQAKFIAMARATQKNVEQWQAVPEREFRSYHPKGEKNPNLQIAETYTQISDCRFPLRTVLIRDDTQDTRQRWRALFTNVAPEKLAAAEVDVTYRRRQDHENSFAELDHALAVKCLPKPYRLLREANGKGQKRRTVATLLSDDTMAGLKVVAWLRHWAYNLVKDLAAELDTSYRMLRVGTFVRKFIVRPGVLSLRGNELWVTLTPFTECEVLTNWIQQVNQQRLSLPWLNHLILQLEIAPSPVGLAANPRAVRRRVFANSHPPGVT